MAPRSRSAERLRASGLLPWGVLAFSFAGVQTLFWGFSVDDSFITARYAENLVDRGELVFNLGERVAAFTSPLHTLIEAALYRLTAHTVLANKLLSAAALVAAVALGARVLQERNSRFWFGALVLLSPFVNVWSVGGLETTYLLAFVMLLAVLSLRVRRDASAARSWLHAMLMGCTAALCFLIRFDSAIFCAVVIAGLVARSRRHPLRVVAALVPAVVLVTAWVLFAWRYYHEILPTSFYVKTPHAVGRQEVLYVVQFFLLSGLSFLALPGLRRPDASVHSSRPPALSSWLERLSSPHVVLLAAVGAQLAYSLTMALVHMMFSYRALVPYLPVWALLGLSYAESRAATQSALFRVGLWATLALQTLMIGVVYRVSLNPGMVGEMRSRALHDYAEGLVPALQGVAQAVRAHWEARQGNTAHAEVPHPRLLTFTGGVPAYTYRDIQAIEALVSSRHDCILEYGATKDMPMKPYYFTVAESADYVHVRSQRNGRPISVKDQLPGPESAYELVWESEPFVLDDGLDRFAVYYRKHPAPYRVPAEFRGSCPQVDEAGYRAYGSALALQHP